MEMQCRSGNGANSLDTWMPFLRQLHMSSGVWTLYFMNGLSTGAPTVLVPQIKREWNSTVIVDDELASWIYSASNLAAVPWIFFLPALSQLIGRKIPYLVCCAAMSTVFTLLYFSSAPYHVLTAESIQGLVNASTISVIMHVIPEYCDHRHRNVYLNIQATSFHWGMWVSKAIGTFVSWKYIAVTGLICSLYSFTVSFYPESPRWLASKGRLRECESAHTWLRGSSPEAEKELRDLIKSQTGFPGDNDNMTCFRFMNMLICKAFYMPLTLVILVGVQYNFSGKFVYSVYAIDIVKKITKNEETAYTGMLILDGVTVFGMYVGCILSRILKLRPLFLKLSSFSVVVMFTLSLYLYLAKLKFISENNTLTIGLLIIYSLAVSTGPIILSLNYYSVLISPRYQAVSYMITSFIFLCSCTGIVKFSPVIFKQFGIHGSFLFYGLSSGVSTILLYVYLPETKNKTLVEIEEHFKDTKVIPEAETLTKHIESKSKISN